MRKIAVLVAIVLATLTTGNAANAAENFNPRPERHCQQDSGLWRVWGHLVFLMEDCSSIGEDISPPDSLVVIMYPRPSWDEMVEDCNHMGGRHEYVALLHICWDVDY